MEIKRRTIHADQRSTVPSLLEAQQRLLWEQWSNDLEIYDNDGELLAITHRENPNLDRLLANLRSGENATRSS
jgi:hypothetical protein